MANKSVDREADFVSGDPLMVDYIPGADVVDGEVVPVGNIPCVAHISIAAGELGALAHDGGIYEVDKLTSDDVSAGDDLYFDTTNNRLTLAASGNLHFGYAAADAGTAATRVTTVHSPNNVQGS